MLLLLSSLFSSYKHEMQGLISFTLPLTELFKPRCATRWKVFDAWLQAVGKAPLKGVGRCIILYLMARAVATYMSLTLTEVKVPASRRRVKLINFKWWLITQLGTCYLGKYDTWSTGPLIILDPPKEEELCQKMWARIENRKGSLWKDVGTNR